MQWYETGEGLQSRRLSWKRECEAAGRARVGVSTQIVIKLLTPGRDNGSLTNYSKVMISLTCFPESSRTGQLIHKKDVCVFISIKLLFHKVLDQN